MITLLLHISAAEPVKVDVEDLPDVRDQIIIGRNPRDKADRELNWIEEGVSTLIFPWWRITFVEVLPSEEEGEAFPLPFRND
ncbi:MAG: hypothetical protein KJ065_05065 [Anaerolineae bacterium]|nr:hypothetical protein [Anaerolineae bacterium]